MTILLVDQMATLALSVADRAYVLQSGTIMHSGSAREVARDPALMRAYLGDHGPTVSERSSEGRTAMDLILRNARRIGAEHELTDIGIAGGKIAAIEPGLAAEGETIDLGGRLVSPGFRRDPHPSRQVVHPRPLQVRARRPRRGDRARSPRPRRRSPRRTSMPAPRARWRRRSSTAPPTCARISRSIPASGCAASKACCRWSRNMPGRSTSRSASSRRRACSTIRAPTS